jgi:autotransporter-associated beta strand protein
MNDCTPRSFSLKPFTNSAGIFSFADRNQSSIFLSKTALLGFLIVFFLNQELVKAQTLYDWLNTAPDGNFRQGAAAARWNPGGLFDEPPSTSATRLRFNNNTFTTMTNNVGGTYTIGQLFFGSFATTGRTIGGNPVQFFEFGSTWPRIENQSTALHTINFPFSASTNSGFNMELVASAGPLVFGGTLNNNGRTVQIYGNGTATDANNRYVRLGGIVSGTGVLNVSQFGAVRLSAAHSYTGQTQIDNGELWIESGGSIAAGSGIFVGNGGQLGNVAKLWLSNATGGTTFSNGLTINDGNLTTREIGGLNTSGTNTFSGGITNNSTTGGLRLTALNAGGTVSFSGALGGSGSYIAPGAGTLTLSNTGNNYTGTTTVSGGTLRLGAANVIPNGSNIILAGGTFSTGATTGFADVMGTLQVTGNSTINFGTGFHNLEFANSSAVNWTPTANLIITGWVGPYDGVSGATAGGRFLVNFPNGGGLTSSQLARIYFFNGTNYFTATQLSNGEVVPNADIAMFWGSTSAASWTTTSVTPRWDLNPTSTTFANNWATNRAAVFNVANSTITGASTNVASITANESVTTTATGTLNFGVGGGGIAPIFVASGKVLNLSTQTIATSVGYIKNGPGTLQLAGSAFTQGVTLNEGMIAVGGLNAMGNGGGNYLQINGGTIAGTASFNFTNTRFPGGIFVNGDFSLGSATPPALSTATLGFNNTVDLGSFSTRTITLGGTGIISLNGAISGTGTNLIIASSVASTLSLGAANTYTANTTINGGTLRCGIAGALPSSTNVTLANSTGVRLNLNNFSQTVASISGGGASGGNISIHTAATTAVLTVDQTTNTSYNGIISGSGGGFTKSGAGTLTLGGANTYTGTTSINGGTLQLGAAERIANTSNVALSGGTLSTGGFSETLGTLTLNTSSVISLGAGAHNLTFASSSAVTWASSSIATLIINGWTGTAGSSGTAGKIFFGNTTGTLTAAQLAQIVFTGYSPGATLRSDGELVPAVPVTPGPPSVTSFNPSSGQIGTLVTITGINLGNPTAFSIGGIAAISVSNDGTTLVGMVMPGASTGAVSVTTAQGTSTSGANFTVRPTPFPTTQQGLKLVGTSATGAARQGQSVALSANGNTAIVGGINDNGSDGAVWVYTRSGTTWAQQGTKLVGTGGIVAAQGSAVALSADGNTAVVGGNLDNGNQGAVWVFVRSGSTWFQQGSKLVGTGAVGSAFQGSAVAISADGNTILSGGYFDNTQVGAVWVFTRSSGFWTQQGSKLVGTGATGASYQGVSVSLSADGNTAMVGGSQDNSGAGAAWVFTRSAGIWSQQGSKLLPTGATGNAERGRSVSLSADGNTALIGGPADNSSRGATWVFTRTGTSWSQQGTKLVGTGFTGGSNQGVSSALSADGNSAVIGGWFDNSQAGAIWVYTRSGTTWTQQGSKLVGTGATGTAQQGFSVGLSSDGFTAMVGGPNDNTSAGAAWIYVLAPPTITTTVAASSITNTTASSGGQTITGAALTAKGVVFSLGTVTTTPTLSNGVFTDASLPVTATDFTGTLSGLAPQRQYYARAYASNAGGTGYATAVNFWTLSNPPSAQASGLTVTPTAAGQLTASWTAATWPGFNANRAGYALIYSTSTPTLASANGTAPAAGVGTLVNLGAILPTEPALTSVINGLTSGTTYNFLLVPFTWDGTNASTYHYFTAGAPTFSATAASAPTITSTTAIASINESSASGGGSGISAGGGNIIAKGVVWNTAVSPTISNNSTNDGTGTADFSSSLTSLNPQTLYYVRAYASNELSTAYGNQLTFRTLSNEPTAAASLFSATVASPSQINLGWTAATFPASGASANGYIILRRSDGTDPASTNVNDGVAPASLTLPSGTNLAATISSGATISFNNTGLSAATLYNYLIIPFTWDGVNGSTYNYLTALAPTASDTTLAAVPTGQPSALVFSDVSASTITASWNPATGSPDGYLVLRSTGSAPNSNPVPGISYAQGDVLGNATVVYAGSAASTGIQSGLLTATTYFYEVYSFNGSGGTINYRTISPLSGNQSTWLCNASPALLTWYLDADADGWYISTQTSCTSPGTGWTSTPPSGGSSDCDDSDPTKSTTFSFYADTDGDGFGTGSLISGICAVNNTTAPAGYSINNTDCAPTNPSINARFSFYADADGDGFGSGSLQSGICAENDTTAPTGYSTNNTDCAPGDNTKWQQDNFYIDQDNDGYDGGTANVCYGSSIPSPYKTNTSGSDCNDNDNLINTSIPAPLTTNISRCGPGSVLLTATSTPGETIDWYADALGGTALLSGNSSYSIPSIGDTTVFYAEARNAASGCVSSARTPLTVTVIPLPTAIINANDFVCEGQTAPIDIEFIGTSPWNLQYSINSVPQPAVNSASSTFSTTYPNASVARNYVLNALTDATGCSATVLDTLLIDVPIPCYITWNGSVNNDWNNANNWTPNNSAPSSRTSVVLGAAPNQPQINTASPAAVCANAIFQPGSLPVINSGFSISVRGDLSGNGGNNFSGDGKVILNGTGSQNVIGNVRLGNVEFANSNGGVTVLPGSKFEIASGATATFLPNSKLLNSGDFVLASTASGTARIGAIPTSAVINGNMTIERWLPHGSGVGSWFLIGTPFSGQNFTGLSDDFRVCGPDTGFGAQGGNILPASQPERFTVFRYAENLNNTRLDTAQKEGWRSPANSTMNAGTGYRVYVNYYSNSLHKFDTKGTLNRNDFTFPQLTRTVNTSCSPISYGCDLNLNGWNLLANPYPCPVDWNAASGWTKPANMNNAFYVWNSLAGGYRAFNGPAAVNLGVTVNSEANPNVIPSSQGFFVKLLSGNSGSLVVKETAKVTNTSGSFLRTAITEASLIQMRLKKAGDSGYHFDAMVRFEEGSTEAFDAHRDMDILTGSSYEFGFPNSNTNLLLNSQAILSEETRIVPIRMDLKGQTGVFSFEILAQDLPSGSVAFIRDLYLGEITEVTEEGNFTFTVSDIASGSDERFELVISPNLVTGALPQGGKERFLLSPNPTNLEKGAQVSMVGFSGKEVQILVSDVTGRKIISQKLNLHNGALVYPLNCSGIPAGIYSIQVTTADKKLITKLILK